MLQRQDLRNATLGELAAIDEGALLPRHDMQAALGAVPPPSRIHAGQDSLGSRLQLRLLLWLSPGKRSAALTSQYQPTGMLASPVPTSGAPATASTTWSPAPAKITHKASHSLMRHLSTSARNHAILVLAVRSAGYARQV